MANRWSNERFSPTMTITCLIGVTVLASPLAALLACPGVEVKLAATKTAVTDNRVRERAIWSAQAFIELFCCFFMGVVPFGLFSLSNNPDADRIGAQ